MAEAYIGACTRDFGAMAVVRVCVKGTTLNEAAGDYKAAGAALRAVWTRTFGPNLSEERLEQVRDVVPADLFDYVKASIAHGVDAAYDGPRGERQKCKAHPSVTGKVIEVIEASWKDVQNGRAVMATIGPAWRS